MQQGEMRDLVTDHNGGARGHVSRFTILSLLLLGCPCASALAQIPVNTCGQSYSGSGALVADLDCTGFVGAAVTVENNGSLDLAGFTLTANDAVLCAAGGGCTVTSSAAGGLLDGIGAGGTGIEYVSGLEISDITIRGFGVGTDGNSIVARNVAIESNHFSGIDCWKGKMVIEDCTFTDNRHSVHGFYTKTIIRGTTFTDNNNGSEATIFTDSLIFEDSTITGTLRSESLPTPSEALVRAEKAKIRNVAFDSNDGSLSCARRCTLKDVTISNTTTAYGVVRGNKAKIRADRVTISDAVGDGFNVRSVKLRDGSITGVSGDGARAGDVRVRDSIVSGNGLTGLRAIDRIGGVAGRSVGGKVVVKDSEVTGNGEFGVAAESDTGLGGCGSQIRAKLSGSVVTGNGTDAGCGTTSACADVTGCQLVHVSSSSTCDTSYVQDSGIPGMSWGVCSAD